MGSHIHKKLRINAREDRISRLPDELIHHILSFLDARFAVQTSVLSKRWKFIWTTLPYLLFDERIHKRVFVKFLDHVFDRRSHGSNILKLKLEVKNRRISSDDLKYYVKYAIVHNVQDLHVEKYSCDVSIFDSKSLKKLNLAMDFDRAFRSSDDRWYLPALTSLHLIHLSGYHPSLPDSCFTCLPALTNLCLEGFYLPHFSSLPSLTMLHLKSCQIMPKLMWDLPALISLELDHVRFGTSITEFLSTLVNLQNLKILSCFERLQDCLIWSPQLLHLELRTTNSDDDDDIWIPNISIFAPKLLNGNIAGIFSITCSDSKLENVHVKLHGCFEDMDTILWVTLKQYYRHLMFMFRGLDSAKTLALDSNTIDALSAIVYDLECSSSPFHNLKYVKLPQGYNESSICGTVKSYLLGGSPGATIVITLQQNDVISRITPGPLPPKNPTIELVDSQNVHKKVCSSGVVDGKVGQAAGALVQGFGGLVPVAPESCDYWASSSKENNNLGLWQGHEVNSEFLGLLDLIMKKHPQTFEQFTTNNKKLCTMKLNMLCTSIIAFTTTNMTEINTEMITEYKTLFSDLQRSFNVKWFVSHLNCIEQFLFSQHELHTINSCIGDAAAGKLQVLKKAIKVEEDFGTMGTTNFDASVGDIGDDDLLPVLTSVGVKKTTTNDEEVGTNHDSSGVGWLQWR